MDTGNRPLKLLYLSYYFRPINEVACVRTWNTAKYLSRLGWDVTLLTVDPNVWRYKEDDESVIADLQRENIHRITVGQSWRFLSPDDLDCQRTRFGMLCRRIARHLDIDPDIGWMLSAKQSCSSFQPGDADIVLATGSPFAGFDLAQWFARRIECPYVLDYRDLWTFGNAYQESRVPVWSVLKEQRMLNGSAAVFVVSNGCAESITKRFRCSDKVRIITNGYDPDELSLVKPASFGHFAITYTGRLYPPKRVISPIISALEQLERLNDEQLPDWRFHYYGPDDDLLLDAVQSEIGHRIVLHGKVLRREALAATAGAAISVIITSVYDKADFADKGEVTGKVFEALGLGTPILLVAPPGCDTEAIVERSGAARRFTGGDVDGIARFIAGAMKTGFKTAEPPIEYAWPHLAKSMDAALRRVVAGKRGLKYWRHASDPGVAVRAKMNNPEIPTK